MSQPFAHPVPQTGPTHDHARVDVLGVQISAVNPAHVLDAVGSLVEHGRSAIVTFTGVHGVMESQRDPDLLAIHNRTTFTCPDGIPMVWASRLAGAPWTERVYGPDFLLAAAERSLRTGWRHFFYGGGEGVAELLRDRLQDRFPGLPVAGTYTPPFRPLTEAEGDDVVRTINQSGADLVWVGLSTPKQERWAAEFSPRLDSAVVLTVGAAFDMHAGLVSQAPPLVQRSGMEWAYRLACEPRRLWRRYLSNNPRFVIGVLRRPPRLADATHCA
jgi:N-acetylglucosaminyldiphosphoundecaprenol N-acetyl-beta-D-mannosaminyltransferase